MVKLQWQVKFIYSESTLALAAGLVFLSLSLPVFSVAQTNDSERPIPILTGNAGYFTHVEGGQAELVPEINPVLLVPFGDHWLVEARAGFEGEFARENGTGPYRGMVGKEIDYLQVDYIANPYLTVTAGRFLTPFGIYNERLYPIWIRALPTEPLIFPIATGSSDGLMLRGGFALNPKVNLNYAAYFSTLSTVNKLNSDRRTGGRAGLFFPGQRVEVGVSWQKLLQEGRNNAFGFHFEWQPPSVPLTTRVEYARSQLGDGYWIEAAYRLSKVPFWQTIMRRTEIVGRGQQFHAGNVDAAEFEEYGLPDVDAQQGDFGLNYYIRDGLKASATYGRQFSADGNLNLWTVGLAYRFAIPLGPAGGR